MPNPAVQQKLQAALENLDSLPAMPITAQKLLALPLNTDEGEAQLLTLIEQDPQIYAKIVGMANSPAMGLSRKVSSVKEAALVLGLSKVKTVAIGIASLSGAGKLPASKHFDPNSLWLHSMTIAMIMRTIAQAMPRKLRPNEDQLFLAGLLHDIGFMALHYVDLPLSDLLHQQISQQPQARIEDIEQELMGMTHCYIGAQLAKHWHLPSEIIAAIAFHHPSPFDDAPAETNQLALLISVAERILSDFGLVENTGSEISEAEWGALCIEPDETDEIRDIANEIAMQAAQMAGAF